MILFLLALFLIAAILVGLSAWLIKRKPWSNSKKKLVFTVVSTFLFFPTIIPAATIAGVPSPNFIAFLAALWELNLFVYLKLTLSAFPLISLFITVLVMRGVSAMIYYEYREQRKID